MSGQRRAMPLIVWGSVPSINQALSDLSVTFSSKSAAMRNPTPLLVSIRPSGRSHRSEQTSIFPIIVLPTSRRNAQCNTANREREEISRFSLPSPTGMMLFRPGGSIAPLPCVRTNGNRRPWFGHRARRPLAGEEERASPWARGRRVS